MTDENINKWMEDVKLGEPLPESKGVVKAIHPPTDIKTKYGERKKCQVIIEGSNGTVVNTNLILPQQFPLLHPKSTLAKILLKYNCKELKELLGKEVEVVEVDEMLWNIKTD
jgi:hypothetical protein